MGDVADMMNEGYLCMACGVFIDDEAFGVPRHCDECEKERQRKGGQAQALPIGADDEPAIDLDRDHKQAMAALEGTGIGMRKCSPVHYQLKGPGGWILNLWPTTQRTHADGKRGKVPDLKLGRLWTLATVARAAAEWQKTQKRN